ncbi:MAG: Uma2 family endonuclease [Pirellulales bacterium]
MRRHPQAAAPFSPGPPDLAIEIILPRDRAGEIDEKVQDWLGHGCQAVWLVNPTTRTVTVFRSRLDITVLTAADTLREPGLLPGFELPVREAFAIPQP